MMSKQDFEQLADALFDVQPSCGPEERRVWQRAVDAVAKACGRQNHRFRDDLFDHRARCGHNLKAGCCDRA